MDRETIQGDDLFRQSRARMRSHRGKPRSTPARQVSKRAIAASRGSQLRSLQPPARSPSREVSASKPRRGRHRSGRAASPRRRNPHHQLPAEEIVAAISFLIRKIELRRQHGFAGRLDLDVVVAGAARIEPRQNGAKSVASVRVGEDMAAQAEASCCHRRPCRRHAKDRRAPVGRGDRNGSAQARRARPDAR